MRQSWPVRRAAHTSSCGGIVQEVQSAFVYVEHTALLSCHILTHSAGNNGLNLFYGTVYKSLCQVVNRADNFVDMVVALQATSI